MARAVRAALSPPLPTRAGAPAPTRASTVTWHIQAVPAALHLFAEASRPAVVSLALDDLARDLVQHNGLPQLVNIPRERPVRIRLPIKDLLHVL